MKSDEACACAARGEAHARAVACAQLAHVVEISRLRAESLWMDLEIFSPGTLVSAGYLRVLV